MTGVVGADDWDVIVLGGSGFIGTHLCGRLRDAGYKPLVVDRSRPADVSLPYFAGGPALLAETPDLVERARAVIHLAWSTTPQTATEAPELDLRLNVAEALPLLARVARASRRIRFVFISTGGAIYGPTAAPLIGEEHPTAPLNAYGVSKLAYEHYARLFHHLYDLDHVILRPSNPYGELQRPDGNQGAIAVFMGKLARGEPLTVWGDGSVVRDYFYVGDLADAIVASLSYVPGDRGPRLFNVGSGHGLDLRTLIDHLGVATGRTPDVRYSPGRRVDAPRTVLDIARIAEHLGWQPATALETGLARTWAWITTKLREGR